MLGISSVNNTNYSSRNNNVKFGMALKLDPSAHAVIKKQAFALGEKGKNNFFTKLKQAFERQENNPVDIIIRKAKHRKALAAEIVDSDAGKEIGGIKNMVTSQPLVGKNGSLRFLNKAEKKANKLNETNNQVKDIIGTISEAGVEDYKKTKLVKD